ncbi:MAG: glycosyltransferase family 39 protein [Proteobacteria bacterium]|nr:glycosyltransferase family 39 protein [Pseudomonadota bacterium]
MTALGVVLLQTLCCLGLGAAALRTLKIDADLGTGEHWALSFATGFGILGWLIFPLGVAGYLSAAPLTALLTAGALAAVLLRRPGGDLRKPRTDILGKALLALIGIVGVFDFMEGIAPPADADTAAYHFVVAKQFLEAGRIGFIYEPIVGAVPFGVQMTYVPALGLGGEKALTLWTMVSGWAAAVLLFVLCRRHIGLNWSLAVTLIFLTTPAVIYGGGTGQIEPRAALYVMISAWAVSRALETGRANYAVLAGLGAGFFAAAKYTGLLFIAVSGPVLLFQRRWLSHGVLFGAAFLAAGFQWYAWNVLHTGDPVFPMLYQWLVQDEHAWWTKAYDLAFKEGYFDKENPLPRSLFWLLAYPFKATLGGTLLPDAGRVNFGVYGLLVFPFAALGLWRFRDRVRKSPLLTYALLAFLFYVLWFFFGGSQRIRHLLPVLPLFLISATVAAERLTAGGAYRGPLMASVAAVVVLQMAGHGLFALNYVKYLIQDTSREAFLNRNVNAYAAVPWINANLKKTDRIFILRRQLRYYLQISNFYGSPHQMEVEWRPGKTDARSLYRQLRQAGVTHVLISPDIENGREIYKPPMDQLDEMGCLVKLRSFKVRRSKSRTLPALASERQTLDVLRLADEGCLR